MLKVSHTICPSCSVGCGINLITKNERVVGTYPYKRHSINEGKNCLNGRECFEKLNKENRLKTPLIKNRTLLKAEWNDALELITNKMSSYKAEEIGIIGSGKCTNEECETLKKFADVQGIDNIGFYAENFPSFNFESGGFDDIENSKYVLVIGDVLKENPLMGRRIILAKDKGAKIISIDYPDTTITGMNSDEYIKIDSIQKFLDKNIQNIMRESDNSMVIIVNKLDNKNEYNEIHEIISGSKAKLIPVMNECNTRGAMQYIPPLDIGELKSLIERVKLLYVVGGNPAVCAESSLKKLDFLITESPDINQTTLMSDVALPSSFWAEEDGSFTNTMGIVQEFSKIVPPPLDVFDD